MNIRLTVMVKMCGLPGADLGLLQWWGCSSNAREARAKFWATPT